MEQIRLTPRETAVLQRLARGLTVQAVAHELRIAPGTVNKHLEKAYRKLGASDRVSAVLIALRAGLI
jgi:DNA-binding NarL/FixJ family response regulator